MAPPRTGARGSLNATIVAERDRPYRSDHERSTIARWERHPQRLRDLVRELQEAREAEVVTRLHRGGVEWEKVGYISRGPCSDLAKGVSCTHRSEGVPVHSKDGSLRIRDSGGTGSPRWTTAFKAYITGPDCDTTEDGDWRWPLRSSLFRLSISRSGTDRLAAAFCWLLIQHRYNVREAWAAQCGVLADPAIADAAEAWAGEALGRWWGRYIEQPMGRPL